VSIRQRLILIVFLAGIALTAAFAAVAHLVATSDATRVENAKAAAHGGAEALVDLYVARDASVESATLTAPTEELRRWLFPRASLLLASVPRAEAGFCTASGIVVATRGARKPPKSFLLAPDHRTAIAAACAARPEDRAERLPSNELLAIAIVATPDGGAAFTSISLGKKETNGPTPWQVEIGILVLGTLAVVAVSLDALFALRRGAGQLEVSLARLGDDLGAEVTRPRAEELGRIADGLKKMAMHLAEAHSREQALGKKLAHEQRLAGLGRVAAGVAHEIRNPLAGMKLRLDLLVRSLPDGEVKDDVRACLDEIARLDRVVRSLLVVARREPQAKKEIDLGALVQTRIELVKEQAAARSIDIVTEGGGRAMTDADAVSRIVDNLLRNAIEASPDARPVRVRVASVDGSIELVVEDEGPGVPAEREAEMFEPFFTTKAEGTGLGLWLSRSLGEGLGGTLAYAREGGRTKFRLTLPARDA
jgi:signal transduction histidine kinase